MRRSLWLLPIFLLLCLRGDAPALAEPPSATLPSAMLLRVPLVEQWALNDCGVAALAMVLDARAIRHDSIGRMARLTPLAQGDEGLRPLSVQKLAAHYGLPLRIENRATWDVVQREIAAGRAVLQVVGNPYPGLAWGTAHWVVVVGYNERYVIVNDPAGVRRYIAFSAWKQDVQSIAARTEALLEE